MCMQKFFKLPFSSRSQQQTLEVLHSIAGSKQLEDFFSLSFSIMKAVSFPGSSSQCSEYKNSSTIRVILLVFLPNFHSLVFRNSPSKATHQDRKQANTYVSRTVAQTWAFHQRPCSIPSIPSPASTPQTASTVYRSGNLFNSVFLSLPSPPLISAHVQMHLKDQLRPQLGFFFLWGGRGVGGVLTRAGGGLLCCGNCQQLSAIQQTHQR